MCSRIFFAKKHRPYDPTINLPIRLMKRILFILLSVLASVSFQSGAQQNTNASADKAPTNQSSIEREICFLNIGRFEWFSLRVVMSLYSTHKQEGSCDKKRYEALTLASIKAQLRGVQKFDFVIRGGHYHYLMDSNLSPVQNQYYMIGSMRFSPNATIKINIFDFLFEQKSITDVIVNASYKPFLIEADAYYIWDIGSKAHQLIDPEGKTYIMLSYTTDVYPNLNLENLDSLNNKLVLPKGWKYETIALDKTVKIRTATWAENHNLTVIDDVGNVYIKYD